MTDAQTPAEDLPQLQVNMQYIKDLSFEIPGAPHSFIEMQGKNPEIPIHVDVNVGNVGANAYEVVLHLKVEALLEGKALFILELAYAGVFTLNLPEEQIHPVLLIECPRLLFPFARNIVADMTRDGGLPPLLLQPLDFVELYRARAAEMSAQQGQA
ncbi:Protein export cytoplasm chaperone protein (SecB maintains protein to be exported in unfolded state) [Paramagnetospirillum magnetotacticum MS-1]|uniref:Protein-export protein SecB n=1 Tax=Paramagnetospirillum magnetotacticum MS-1 TaxID=272627 RepID=A0A0C2YDU9_PARME|nr:protein-export chaperone SecB [Paramagnetospirillum magnetotacticum]KIL97884.1 Protein export cytoplasm chaperone protein (SecB maintains protein to be exported in unfolded state) [Paramagnetospirillum magnetotacticum MS-1]